MANSQLQHKSFPVPDEVLLGLSANLKKFADKRESKGFNRALFILQRRECTYEQLKRIKNYFDTLDPKNIDVVEYSLNGGELMQKWVNFILNQARDGVRGSKTVMKNAGQDNQFRAPSSDGDGINPVTPVMKKVPEFMTSNDLMEEINKIKDISKKLI